MSIINKYTIWVVGEGKELFEELRNNGDCQKLSLNLLEGETKDKFSKEEIDYVTSAFLTEKDFVKYLSSLSLFVNSNSHIEITHQYQGMRKDKPIYGNKYLHSFSKEVLENKKRNRENPYYLSDTIELYNFVEDMLDNCDIDFLLGCKREIISPRLIILLSHYTRLDSETDSVQRDNLAREIIKYCKNYDTVRKIICVQQSLKRDRYDKNMFGYLNANMIKDLMEKPIESMRLGRLYKAGGVQAVLDNMQAIDILTCSANDLRKVGVLPFEFTVWEYRSYQKLHPELVGEHEDYEPIEDKSFVDTRNQQIENPFLNNLYERYRGEDGKIDAEALFNDISIDDIYNNPNNFDDLVALGLIPEGTEKKDVFYSDKDKSSSKK